MAALDAKLGRLIVGVDPDRRGTVSEFVAVDEGSGRASPSPGWPKGYALLLGSDNAAIRSSWCS